MRGKVHVSTADKPRLKTRAEGGASWEMTYVLLVGDQKRRNGREHTERDADQEQRR
jgi:hypothetical protein